LSGGREFGRAALDAFRSFGEHLAAVEWTAVALALLCHVGKMAARTRAWRNILAASYPDAVVRWRTVLGSYVAGVGVNAVMPARAGDVLKLYLVKRRVAGSTYPTLAATLLVETLFDMLVAAALLAWALHVGVLPSLDVVPRLPAIDWLWLFLPLTPAGIGTEQALLVYVLSGEASSSALLSFSVGMKVVLVAANVALGAAALALVLRTLRWRKIVERETARAELP
jgi:uncharacterized membrane protein YbhN (UPF0104 family)